MTRTDEMLEVHLDIGGLLTLEWVLHHQADDGKQGVLEICPKAPAVDLLHLDNLSLSLREGYL